MSAGRHVRRRWLLVSVASIAVPVALVAGLGHRGVHAVRNLLVPGAGLYDHTHFVLGLAFTAAFVVATVAWVRWGVDWAVVVVIVGAAATSAALTTSDHPPPAAVMRGAHEFPLVVLVASALAWARQGLTRIGVVRPRRRATSSEVAALAPVERCQAVAVARLAGSDDPALGAAVTAGDVARRARRVGLVARARRGGDPFRIDHAHARAARSLCGVLDAGAHARLVADAARGLDGVPCSEPGWVRLLDGTLAAMALHRAGDEDAGRRWAAGLSGRWALRRRHRPAWVWAPLGLPLAHAAPWEHAAATGIARAARWCGDEDWPALRRSALAAAARGARRPADERLVAAGRVWTAQVDDDIAARVLARPTIGHDPLAAALDLLAQRLRDDPDLLRAPPKIDPAPGVLGGDSLDSETVPTQKP